MTIFTWWIENMEMSERQQYLEKGLISAREAARELARCEDGKIRSVLESLADRTIAAENEILQANLSDLARMPPADHYHPRVGNSSSTPSPIQTLSPAADKLAMRRSCIAGSR